MVEEEGRKKRNITMRIGKVLSSDDVCLEDKYRTTCSCSLKVLDGGWLTPHVGTLESGMKMKDS